MIVVDNIFEIGEIVFLKTDRDQIPRIVFGFDVSGGINQIIYRLAAGTLVSNHYDFEISREPNVILITTN